MVLVAVKILGNVALRVSRWRFIDQIKELRPDRAIALHGCGRFQGCKGTGHCAHCHGDLRSNPTSPRYRGDRVCDVTAITKMRYTPTNLCFPECYLAGAQSPAPPSVAHARRAARPPRRRAV